MKVALFIFLQVAMLRPALDDANVKGCKVSKPGEYSVTAGDWIELTYTYPVVPSAIPQKVTVSVDQKNLEPLGTRRIATPGRVGTATIVCHFQSLLPGDETIRMTIDNNEYVYKIKVGK
jgi:hypothetical protein